MDQLKTIYSLTGCTAVGKTELSLRWAEENKAEIVSCDSLLFYRGMDIGTAKPSAEERSRVRHHLIDLLEPNEQMDISRYISLAIETIGEIQSRGKKVLVTGGSGFYLKAFFAPVVDQVRVSAETRKKVETLYEEGGLEACLEALKTFEPQAHEILDTQNPRRVMRGLERCIASGKSLRALKREFESNENALTRCEKRFTVLERYKEELNERIAQRVRQMIDGGLIEEVEHLMDKGIEANTSAAGSIGYRETIAHLKGELGQEEMFEQICANTRRLAKKQRTWFRSQVPEHRVWNLSENQSLDTDELFG